MLAKPLAPTAPAVDQKLTLEQIIAALSGRFGRVMPRLVDKAGAQ